MKNSGSSGGVGVLTVLQIVFIVLKLCDVITWSWWAVLIPLWIDLAICVILIIVLVLINNRPYKKRKSDKLKW